VEGRSLLPLLANPKAEWQDRTLFTHVGRWPKGSDANHAKTANASVRTTQYHLVSEGRRGKAGAQGWQLFDLKADAGELTNIADRHPETVRKMLASYDQWWDSLKPGIDLNEKALGPKLNPFAELYWKQFGGGPSAEDLARMDPEKAWTFETQRMKKNK
jgi:arylsulfatase